MQFFLGFACGLCSYALGDACVVLWALKDKKRARELVEKIADFLRVDVEFPDRDD